MLARWFRQAWAPYYGPGGPGDAEADSKAASSPDRLPVCLVALDAAGEVAGTAAFRAESLASHGHLGPWLAALLVRPERRGRGIGTALVTAVEREARRLGFPRIYTGTGTAGGILERRGWRVVDRGTTLRSDVDVYALDLPGAGSMLEAQDTGI